MVDKTMAETFGETVRLSFMKSGVLDPARPMMIINAILHTGGDDSIQAGDGFRTRLSAGKAELFINRSTYTGPEFIVGDKVRGNDRAGLPLWRVEKISDRYSHLIVLSMSQS